MDLAVLTDRVIIGVTVAPILYDVTVGVLSGGGAPISVRLQHHAARFPIITGVIFGLVCHWFWPVRGLPHEWHDPDQLPRRRRLRYREGDLDLSRLPRGHDRGVLRAGLLGAHVCVMIQDDYPGWWVWRCRSRPFVTSP